MVFASSPSSSFGPFLRSPSAVRVGFRPLRVAATFASAEASAATSLYQVLGVSRGATCHEIKAAYRRLARIWHPDVVASDRKDTSAGVFVKLHAAYSTLSDPEKRADYDQKLIGRPRPFPSGSSSFSYGRAASFGGCGPRTWETDQCW